MATIVNCILSKLKSTQKTNNTTIHSVSTGQGNIKYNQQSLQHNMLVFRWVIFSVNVLVSA